MATLKCFSEAPLLLLAISASPSVKFKSAVVVYLPKELFTPWCALIFTELQLLLTEHQHQSSDDQKNFFWEENCFHFSRILSISIFELRTKIFLSEDKFSISASWKPGQPWHESRIQLRREDDHRPGGGEVQRVRQPHDHQWGGEQAGDCCHRKAKVSTRANFQKIQVLSGLDDPFVK